MERLPGTVYERGVPESWRQIPIASGACARAWSDRSRPSTPSILRATGLDAIGDGHGYLDRELAHWAGEIRRVQRGPLPALERLVAALREQQPEQCPSLTLVHGDAKPGNFAFEGGRGQRRVRLGDGDRRRPAGRHRLGRSALDATGLVHHPGRGA